MKKIFLKIILKETIYKIIIDMKKSKNILKNIII